MNKRMIKFCDKKKEDLSFYSKIELYKIKKPITVLLGPNGTGKSMSMRSMEEELKKYKCEFVTYSTTHNDIVDKTTSPMRGGGDWNPYKLACAFHSEGERMNDSFLEWCETSLFQKLFKTKFHLYVFIDELDSGLSIDKLMQQISLINLIASTEEKREKGKVKFILTCNSYEMVELLNKEITDFIWVPTKDKIKITSYDNFKKRYVEYFEYMKNKDEK